MTGKVRLYWDAFVGLVMMKALLPGFFVRRRCMTCGKRHTDIEAMAGMTPCSNLGEQA